jgi:hypothetical protein
MSTGVSQIAVVADVNWWSSPGDRTAASFTGDPVKLALPARNFFGEA